MPTPKELVSRLFKPIHEPKPPAPTRFQAEGGWGGTRFHNDPGSNEPEAVLARTRAGALAIAQIEERRFEAQRAQLDASEAFRDALGIRRPIGR